MAKTTNKIRPTFTEEVVLWNRGIKNIAGLDEVGRGAFAGPVVVAAVIFPPHLRFQNVLLHEINDSKLLSPKKRALLSELIKNEAQAFSLAEVSVERINMAGIGNATKEAFQKAIDDLSSFPDFCLFDGFPLESFDRTKQKAIIKGDRISFSIAAASIIAKVYRDTLMEEFSDVYGDYGFEQNKGYGTSFHRKQIGKLGLSPVHRTSFSLERFLTQS